MPSTMKRTPDDENEVHDVLTFTDPGQCTVTPVAQFARWFTQAATELIRGGARTFVEVGPGNVLSGLVKRIDRSVKAIPVNSLAALEKLEEVLSTA